MNIVTLPHYPTRQLLLLQGLFEDQQQGLSTCFGGGEGEEQAAGEGCCLPPETTRGSVLRAGHPEIQGQETGWFDIGLKICRIAVVKVKTYMAELDIMHGCSL